MILIALGALAMGVPAAASAAPIALDSAGNGSQPDIAYDPSTMTTYVAWTDPQNNGGIDLCILASSSATTCSGGAPVVLTDSKYPSGTDNAPVLGAVVVLPNGDPVVIGATAEGAQGSMAWESSPGGATFLTTSQGLLNSGNPISKASLYYSPFDAVALGSSDVGLLSIGPGGTLNNFDDSALNSASDAVTPPPVDPSMAYGSPNLNYGFAPIIAAEAAPSPAPANSDILVGVGQSTSTPSGCSNANDTGFGVSVGTLGSAGTLNSEGLPNYGVLDCNANDPVLASGGTDGIGLLEQEGSGVGGSGSDYAIYFRPFLGTSAGGSFGTAVELQDVSSQVLTGVDTLDLSDDSGAGVYGLWTDSQGAVMDYSPDGGALWGPPVVTPAPYGADDKIAGISGGTADIAYDTNASGGGDQVFVQPVSYASLLPVAKPAATTLTTTQASGANIGPNISIPAGTVGETDQATISGSAASSATGTVSYGLFSSPTCAASTEVSASSGTVAGGVSAPSVAVTSILPAGKYYWAAVYSGNATNAASASACGSEVLTVTPAGSIGGGGSSTRTTVTITVTCAVVPCTVTVTITVDPPARTATAAKKKKPKIVTIAKGHFTIKKKGSDKLTVKLNGAGKSLYKKDHGKFKATALIKIDGQTLTRTVHFKPAKHKHK